MAENVLHDISTQNQIIVEKIKAGAVRDYNKIFNEIGASAAKLLQALDVDDLGELTVKQLNKLLSELSDIQTVALFEQLEQSVADFEEFSTAQMKLEEKALKSLDDSVELLPLKYQAAYRKVLKQPISATGELLEPFMKDWARKEVKALNNIVRRGWAEGRTVPQLVREIRGTRARNFKDGVTAVSKRHAEAVVRTSIQQVASHSRQQVWENNDDLVKQYKWSSTLDSRTSTLCRSLDGRVFDIGEGIVPPAHINCRSSTVAVLAPEFDFLDKGRTRFARGTEGRGVSADTTYYQWLKTQNKSVQELALGKERTKLFREGGLSAKRFGELQLSKNFSPMTLEEMQKLEPAAFRQAEVEV